jgi:cell wall-associated NlpC family hydrolase
MYAKERLAIVDYAKKYIGTPYVWAGNEPTGFDCSGFTSYVMKNFKKELPRRAVDQYNSSRQLKEKNVMMGDLVFFDNGSGISHVGMIISEKGKPLVMIHASSSKGVVITEIEKSDYWLKRLYGFGTYVY